MGDVPEGWTPPWDPDDGIEVLRVTRGRYLPLSEAAARAGLLAEFPEQPGLVPTQFTAETARRLWIEQRELDAARREKFPDAPPPSGRAPRRQWRPGRWRSLPPLREVGIPATDTEELTEALADAFDLDTDVALRSVRAALRPQQPWDEETT